VYLHSSVEWAPHVVADKTNKSIGALFLNRSWFSRYKNIQLWFRSL